MNKKTYSSTPLTDYIYNKASRNYIPLSGTFELTPICNFNCKMCYVHDCTKKKDALSTEDWLNLAQQAKEAGQNTEQNSSNDDNTVNADFEEVK